MDIKAIHQQFHNLNELRFNEQISHQAWLITVRCINETLESAGYTWDDMIAAKDG